MNDPTIEEVPSSAPDLIAMLAQANLPTEDLAGADIRLFRFSEAGQTIGFIGWETVEGTHVLLRSAVVAPAWRGQGNGRQMILWALVRLAELGMSDVWLLTTSIEELARHLGFTQTERTLAPAGIRRSHQFARLCPSTAVLLHKRLP